MKKEEKSGLVKNTGADEIQRREMGKERELIERIDGMNNI